MQYPKGTTQPPDPRRSALLSVLRHAEERMVQSNHYLDTADTDHERLIALGAIGALAGISAHVCRLLDIEDSDALGQGY